MDGGPVWASVTFPMRRAAKSSLYRNEVTEAAVTAVLEAVERFGAGGQPVAAAQVAVGRRGRWRDAVAQTDRAIDWQSDTTEAVLRKIAAADGMPGVRDELFGEAAFLFDASEAYGLPRAEPGAVIATSGPAIARATRDGAVWIGRVRRPGSRQPYKLPATLAFAEEVSGLPEVPLNSEGGNRDIFYEEDGPVGFLHFPFYNGAMGTDACRRLRSAYDDATRRPTRVVVLCGGPEFWSNGLDLNLIEAADSAADESWANILAIDDLSEAIVRTSSHLTVSALCGNAGAGGVFLARAADEVWLRAGVILNPHYKDMGNLYGSELWTYLLPRHCGPENTRRIAAARLPRGTGEAVRLGLADRMIGGARESFVAQVRTEAARLANDPGFAQMLADKRARRAADEARKPLSAYREEELARMHRNFYGFDPSYHIARHNFVHKVPKSRTPVTIARHRDLAWRSEPARRGKAS